MNRVITAFKEHKVFSGEKHWDANDLIFNKEVQTPPHYADTVEIIINNGALGDIYIGGTRFTLEGNQAFFIPPNTIHSMNYKGGVGGVTVLKINVETLKSYLDVGKLLSAQDISVTELPYRMTDVGAADSLSRVFKNETAILPVCAEILAFFSVLAGEMSRSHIGGGVNRSEGEDLKAIIDWSENNYTERISLSDAAGFLGYNRNYFCKKFKEATGVTYVSYLQTLRISHACGLLHRGYTVSEVCGRCGFENESYFIKLFRRKVGVTPKKYASSGKNRLE